MLKTFFLCKVGVRQTVLSKSIDIISQEKKLSDWQIFLGYGSKMCLFCNSFFKEL